jgi:hypothetical protein
MDMTELLEPLTHVSEPDLDRIYRRRARRRGRRRATLAIGVVVVLALLGLALWIAPERGATVATVGQAQVDTDAEARRVVETLFLQGPTLDEKLAQIDDATGLEAVVAQGMQDDRAHRLTLAITSIDANDPTVVVHLDFSLDGAIAMPNATLELRRVGDRLQATRPSYCALIHTGGLSCPEDSTSTNAFGPDVRLLDAPLGDIPPTVVRIDGPVTLTFQAEAGQWELKFEYAGEAGSGSISPGSPLSSPPMAVAGSGSYLFGVTRPDVARIEVSDASDKASVDTFTVAEIPQLRFFLVPFHNPAGPNFIAIGYAADGTRLTDSRQQ